MQYTGTSEPLAFATLEAIIANIHDTADAAFEAALQRKLDHLTKPLGALGQLETLALQLGLIQKTLSPYLLKPAMLLFAGDHGITAAGVSAYPKDVTWQMVENICSGGAAISVLCVQHDLELTVVDAGVDHDFDAKRRRRFPLLDRKMGRGTADFSQHPAMTTEQCLAAIGLGMAESEVHLQAGANVLGFGEMGIGNTSSASILSHLFTGLDLERCTGRGTGLSDIMLAHKHSVLKASLEHHEGSHPLDANSDPATALHLLRYFGGFEIAAMVGAMLMTARHGAVILVDGFIATAAFLVAQQLAPALRGYAVFCHSSNEQGHQPVLDWLNVRPLLSLDLRLGEGTGCALAIPLLQSACAIMNQMASFDTASVSGPA
ncbi:nicotinate-nucleotide--dimethylbenzimidazole phosphoribosyltransferase [Allohahella marinimesophila]|uniref:Nicotinate-nucleotide--dimethylbenzimidazole phosphoribosyltransferase n=1 Tax=Allohahella marinimesophila TaxID=1054972 RepID=A0ABP7PD58_9GAMM